MASGKDKGGPELEDAPAASFRSAVWEHFGFSATYDDGGKKVVDKTVYTHCATPPICWLIYEDIIPVCQLTAQGGESQVGKNNFYSPQH